MYCKGYTNKGFSGRTSGKSSSDNLSEDCRTPESSLHGTDTSSLPNKRKKSSVAKTLLDKALPHRKKKRYF